ncbi:dihydroorotate dehydrogenase electron transfer subunit [Sporosalibacterium faouarense]|uniref:dihydroorotate dehydrogenase electron transfer subunit n=1 Tax=Sporosalibacterium faouarense TaxID=516123 RepID=UPI00141D452F|nr:dihydroorotate dehydrogenase electron transfer subunit [Sporosalibacterium faouarense]MTI47745.1 dihydroorotate dehydrogenase electron transfer subunit [Bacillota bacterium]
MLIENCRVKKNEKIIEDIYKMEIINEQITKLGKAGQFLQIKVNNQDTPLLRRPISINEIKIDEKVIVIYYKVIGKGTKLLSEVKSGEILNVIGPLGTGFETNYEEKSIALIGGGIGVAPLIELGKRLSDRNKVYSYLGFADNTYLEEEFKKFSTSIGVSTVSGRVGYKGLVVDIFKNELIDKKIDLIFACGPNPMLREIAEIAKLNNIECQVSLEERMACGFGACLGCSIKTIHGMKKVCSDGPVFWSSEVIFND